MKVKSVDTMEEAAGLGLTRQQLAELGAFGIVWESIDLFQRPPLPSVQFAIVLPYTALFVIVQFLQAGWLLSLLPNPATAQAQAPPQLNAPPQAPPPVAPLPDLPLLLWSLILVLVAIFTFCLSLFVVAATFYAVGSIYWGKEVTPPIGFRSMWPKLFVTAVYPMAFVFAVLLGSIFVFSILKITFSGSLMAVYLILIGFTSTIMIFIVKILIQEANGVTYYEETFRFPALRRALSIMNQRWGTGLLLVIIYLCAGSILGFLSPNPAVLSERGIEKPDLILGLDVDDRVEGGYQPVRAEQIRDEDDEK
ncbi:hypothetical protein AXG93_1200s1070 [Marchantia polymorpha subsp. ruderalis]|uniref:Uncharacterized protein n=1 Tax=Marchantia polymorpha subsp. ruderalis TaxID=1480154 RepID=A0A176WJC8_MARPO|nr:hypothetical protein AXG93_1200s1070 [Marchantia polymorpha subsp. ruderalis]